MTGAIFPESERFYREFIELQRQVQNPPRKLTPHAKLSHVSLTLTDNVVYTLGTTAGATPSTSCFQTVVRDTHSMCPRTAGNLGKIIIPFAGLWRVGCWHMWAPGANFVRFAQLIKNTSTVMNEDTKTTLGTGFSTDLNCQWEGELAVNDVLENIAYHNNGGGGGGTLVLSVAQFWATYLGQVT